jgi:segregation and condensation protein A
MVVSNVEMTTAEESTYQISLPDFEGPLDLLLHLVKKHELNIMDIPIAFITDQYLKTLDEMRAQNLDVAGDYLLMAATLAYLKSRELVPPDPVADAELLADGEDVEEADPRQELIRRLLEYQKYKEAANALGGRPVMGRNVWGRGASAETVAGMISLPHMAPLAEVPVYRLIESLERVLQRAKIAFTHDVLVERITITDKINELVDRLERDGTFTFDSCFDFVTTPAALMRIKHEVVVTFLALLEMTRLKMIRLEQPAQSTSIYICRAGGDLRTQASVAEGDREYKE